MDIVAWFVIHFPLSLSAKLTFEIKNHEDETGLKRNMAYGEARYALIKYWFVTDTHCVSVRGLRGFRLHFILCISPWDFRVYSFASTVPSQSRSNQNLVWRSDDDYSKLIFFLPAFVQLFVRDKRPFPLLPSRYSFVYRIFPYSSLRNSSFGVSALRQRQANGTSWTRHPAGL